MWDILIKIRHLASTRIPVLYDNHQSNVLSTQEAGKQSYKCKRYTMSIQIGSTQLTSSAYRCGWRADCRDRWGTGRWSRRCCSRTCRSPVLSPRQTPGPSSSRTSGTPAASSRCLTRSPGLSRFPAERTQKWLSRNCTAKLRDQSNKC